MAAATTDAILPDLIRKAKAMLLAKGQFNQAWLDFWRHVVQPCEEATFYRLLPILRGLVEQFVFAYKRGKVGVAQAAEDFFRQVCAGEATRTWDEGSGFVKFYEPLSLQLGSALGHLFDFHGDAFSDLCDSLPLAGEEVIRCCLASHPESKRPRRDGFLEESELQEAVRALGPQWGKLILEGENYVRSALRAACQRYWLLEVLTDPKGQHGWSAWEQDELAYADHDDAQSSWEAGGTVYSPKCS